MRAESPASRPRSPSPGSPTPARPQTSPPKRSYRRFTKREDRGRRRFAEENIRAAVDAIVDRHARLLGVPDAAVRIRKVGSTPDALSRVVAAVCPGHAHPDDVAASPVDPDSLVVRLRSSTPRGVVAELRRAAPDLSASVDWPFVRVQHEVLCARRAAGYGVANFVSRKI